MIEGNPRDPLHLMGKLPVALHSDYGLQEYCRRSGATNWPNDPRVKELFSCRFDNRSLAVVWGAIVDRIPSDPWVPPSQPPATSRRTRYGLGGEAIP